MQIKVLYVATVSGTMGFFTSHINMLLEQGHTVDFACKLERPINQDILDKGCHIYNIKFKRTPLKITNYAAYKKLKSLIVQGRYNIVHTHTPVASALARLACRNLKNVTVIYTAHGFHFHKGAPLINWLIYYPIEKFLSRYTDLLITINKEDYAAAQKFMNGKTVYIPGVGIDTKKFSGTLVNKQKKRMELGVPENTFVVLSVGELNRNKNHDVIIRSLAKLKNTGICYLICGHGPMENHLRSLSEKFGLEKQVRLLGYRKDMAEIYKAADIFAFPSRREGLGLAALEAMASGLPIVTSNIHGIVDYSINGVTGFNCRPRDVDGFAKAIETLISNVKLRTEMGKYNVNAVKTFDITNAIEIMRCIYEKCLK